ncbi:plasmid stability protein [Bradyrhizobium sp. R2.2-H]|nr:plasmid stability protein [Bradyrhizobium sp. Y-H1]TCU78200.1 plasmid stability protein [Bradyrhizobium sp. R2.2-H]
MAAVTIRNLSEEAHRALKVRAAQHNRSVEAEMRAILEAAVRPEGRLRLGTVLSEMSRKIGLTNADVEALEHGHGAVPPSRCASNDPARYAARLHTAVLAPARGSPRHARFAGPCRSLPFAARGGPADRGSAPRDGQAPVSPRDGISPGHPSPSLDHDVLDLFEVSQLFTKAGVFGA